jgi:hypothetical protein
MSVTNGSKRARTIRGKSDGAAFALPVREGLACAWAGSLPVADADGAALLTDPELEAVWDA